ncbi:hypothetical protein GCM10010170_056760 [Dactylosporangium salmoneum]|uniref:Uncharacterized protein n=1 Tax=Dactylosporangium salmoneum TaxID=53361 RepID=A0ABP5TXE4_9ACTN
MRGQWMEDLVEGREGKPRLRLDAVGPQHPKAAAGGIGRHGCQQGRLPDARVAAQDEATAAGVKSGEVIRQSRHFRFAAEEFGAPFGQPSPP